jgi:hypothetical protein
MTDQPKWTPGPWFIVTPTQGFEVCTIHGVERQPTEDGLGQTWVYIRPESLVRDGEWHWPDEAECTANAHLIAAAPDLYAALDGLLGLLDAGSLYEPQAYAARAALAKARGETK